MAARERIPDDAFVVRCGKPPFSAKPFRTAGRRHPCGVFGISVQSAAGLTAEQLAAVCQNNFVGVTTVAAIRSLGYDVIQTSGEFYHATLAVPVDWPDEAADALSAVFEKLVNPAPRGRAS